MMTPVRLLAVLTLGLAAAPARAEDQAPAADKPAAAKSDAAGDDAKAEVRAATGIENKLPTGVSATFKANDTVFVWSEVTGASGQEVEHVWKRDGKEFRRAKFAIGSKRWKTNSRMRNAAKGAYVVEVVLGDKTLGEVGFTVE
ncbi:MAG TPA: DUF2914 domain-containing protein [Polyangia bacterium]|jgi:Protein of unknown function (DUF2914).|nr:DUF2914 domain-containing protein [Polyangia bacterium]